ncbi:MAG: VOC family protein [Caulobacteraceae bacterium]|nr:VOC family protein [Caulobacteraceae bacterium]
MAPHHRTGATISDLGLTHVAFAVRDLAASLAFYERYAAMRPVHRRADPDKGSAVAWVTDFTRPFVIVLIQAPGVQDTPLGPFGHLGVACDSRETVDRLAALAQGEGVLVSPPTDSGPPVGYWAYLRDPDGNILELAHGQEVTFTVEQADRA